MDLCSNILGTSRKANELLQAVELGIEAISHDLVTDTLVRHIILLWFKVEQWSQEQVLQSLGGVPAIHDISHDLVAGIFLK